MRAKISVKMPCLQYYSHALWELHTSLKYCKFRICKFTFKKLLVSKSVKFLRLHNPSLFFTLGLSPWRGGEACVPRRPRELCRQGFHSQKFQSVSIFASSRWFQKFLAQLSKRKKRSLLPKGWFGHFFRKDDCTLEICDAYWKFC